MKFMTWKFFIILCMLQQIKSNGQSNFLIDYFVFKNVSYVVGFLCSNIEEKLVLSRRLNKFGIRTSFPHLDESTQIFSLIGSKYARVGVFVDNNCFNEKKLNSLLSKASDWRLYGELHSWIIFPGGNLSKVIGPLDELAFGMSTDLVAAVPISGGYELFDVYNPWKEGNAKMNVSRFGNWNQNTSIRVTLTQSKFERRCNLHRLTMKSSFFESKYRPKNMSLEEYLQDYSTLSKDGSAKFGYNMLIHLSEMYNFTFQFGEVETWLPDDWLGPISRALVQNEIQFAGSSVVLTHERIRLTKFVYLTWPFRSCFIFRNPQTRDIQISDVLQPLADECWYATFFVLFMIFPILVISLKQESYMSLKNLLSDSFLTIVGSMCQQSTDFYIGRISTRIIFLNLMILSILIYNYYGAIIVSIRLNGPIYKINDSLNELGKLELKMASEPMLYFDIIFNLLTPWERKVFYEDRWLKIPLSQRFMHPEKAVPLIQKGGFAYHTHPDVTYPLIDKTFSAREICELMEVNPLAPADSALSVNYNSTFFELSKIGLSRMTEVGIRYRQLKRWNSKKPYCQRDRMSIESIDIYEFAPHLMLLAVGVIITIFILLFESLFANCWSDQQKRWEIGYHPSSRREMSTSYCFLLMLCKASK